MGRSVAVIFPVFLGGALVVKEEGTAFQSAVLVSPMLLVLHPHVRPLLLGGVTSLRREAAPVTARPVGRAR